MIGRVRRSSPMGMVAPQQRIASAFTVVFGCYGDVSRYAQERGVCRQSVYRESAWVLATLEGSKWQRQVADLQQQLRLSQQRLAELEARLAQAVVLDRDKQAEVACVAQAMGISLPEVHTLLEVLCPGHSASVATLGRWTKAAGQKASALLAVLDEYTAAQVRQAAADEIYVTDPVLMVVEPESLCWVSGRLTESLSSKAWAEEFRQLPALEQVTRDGGNGLRNGVAAVNEEHQQQGQQPVADQLDHFHTLRGGSQGVAKQERATRQAVAEAEALQDGAESKSWRGKSVNGISQRAGGAWTRASKAM